MSAYLSIDMTQLYNNSGITNEELGIIGNLTGHGSAFHCEYFPYFKEVTINGIPFCFSDITQCVPNNMELNNQVISFYKDSYKAIHVIGVCDNGSFEEQITLMSDDGSSKMVYLGLTDWLEQEPQFDEKLLFEGRIYNKYTNLKKCYMWYQKIPIDNFSFCKILLPDNPAMHIFSITMERLIS